jgi:hypothetical protein
LEPDESPIPLPIRPQIFRRVLERPKRAKLLYLLGAVVLVLAALALAAHRDSREYLVVTPKGIKTVKRDMGRSEVGSILGTPLAAGRDEGCYRYGTPKLDAEFTLYLICYEDGRVTGVTEERFEARRVELPGAAEAP